LTSKAAPPPPGPADADDPVATEIPTARSRASKKVRFQGVFRLTGELLVPVLKDSVVLGCLFTVFGSLFLAWNQFEEFATHGIWARCVFATPASALVRCERSADAAEK
jgi:hypothetical protein